MDADRATPPLPPGLEPAALSALAVEAWMLEPVAPHERASLVRDEAAPLLDGLLVRVARGQGALDVALGESLDLRRAAPGARRGHLRVEGVAPDGLAWTVIGAGDAAPGARA